MFPVNQIIYQAFVNDVSCTYIKSPRDFVWLGIGAHAAFKIDVIALFDVGAIEIAAQTQYRLRNI